MRNRSVSRFMLPALAGLWASGAQATVIPVADASFEAPHPAYGPVSYGQWYLGGSNAWKWNGNAGIQYPTRSEFSHAPDGNVVAFLGVASGYDSSISQTVAINVKENTRYELSVDVGHRADGVDLANFLVELLAGNDVVASGSFGGAEVAAGTFRTLTIDYDAVNAIDLPLSIRFRTFYDPAQGSSYRQADIDNVRLTASQLAAVPEPASWAMMVGGFGAIGGLTRRRKVLANAPA